MQGERKEAKDNDKFHSPLIDETIFKRDIFILFHFVFS